MQTAIKVVHLQLAIIDTLARYEPLEEYQTLNRALGGLIVDTPLVLPVPQDAGGFAPDIPVVQAGNVKLGINLNIGRKRIDFMMALPEPQKVQEFERLALTIIERYRISGFGRLGLVGQFIVETTSPAQWLKDTFLKSPSASWEEPLLRFNHRSSLHGLTINHIYQFQEVFLDEGGRKVRKAHIQLDVNTFQPGTTVLSQHSPIAFFRAKLPMFRSKSVAEVLS